MTPKQRDLARHALGLPNTRRKSYRNRFYIGDGSIDYPAWAAMVEAGEAEKTEGGRLDCFSLTQRGAEAALNPGERLCREDFPTPQMIEAKEMDNAILKALALRGNNMTYVLRNILAREDETRRWRGLKTSRVLTTCRRLERRKLIKPARSDYSVQLCWQITPAGRAALEQEGG